MLLIEHPIHLVIIVVIVLVWMFYCFVKYFLCLCSPWKIEKSSLDVEFEFLVVFLLVEMREDCGIVVLYYIQLKNSCFHRRTDGKVLRLWSRFVYLTIIWYFLPYYNLVFLDAVTNKLLYAPFNCLESFL